MMKNILSSILILGQILLVTPAKAALSESDRAILDVSKQLLKNPGFENGSSFWTASGGATATANATAKGTGALGYDWDSNGAAQTLTSSSVTILNGLLGKNGTISCQIKTVSGTATHTLGFWDGTTLSSTQTITSSTTSFEETKINFIFPSSGTAAIRITSVNANEPEIYIDDCKISLADNIGTVAQANIYGGVTWVGATGCQWTHASNQNSYVSYTANSNCTLPTGGNLTGKATAPATKIPAVTFATIPPGDYEIIATGMFTPNTNRACTYAFYDGTTNKQSGVISSASISGGVIGNATIANGNILTAKFSYTAPQSNITFEIRGTGDNSSDSCDVLNTTTPNRDLNIWIKYIPSSSQQAVTPEQQKAPTIQKFLSGSGTYTKPSGVVYLKVKMVGGGGSGASGTGTAGGAGGDTTFGTSLLTATGGGGGSGTNATIAAGGTATVNSPAISIIQVSGGTGSARDAALNYGGEGGNSFFSGAGGSKITTGGAAAANSGSGGGGADNGGTAGGGGGGSAGGYLEAQINNPSATYSYSVGSGGATGGGAGGSGVIIVEETYGMNAPILVGSITSSSSGALKDEYALVNISSASACSFNSQSSSSMVSCSAASSVASVTMSGFSSNPVCTATSNSATSFFASASVTSATNVDLRVYNTSATIQNVTLVNLHCIGPR